MRLLPLALGVLWPAIAIAGASEEELDFAPTHTVRVDEGLLVATIVHTPRLPEAESAVRELLSLLETEERIVELRQWVERLAFDPVITFRRPGLAADLRGRQLSYACDDANAIERESRETKTVAAYERCAETYEALAAQLEHADLPSGYWALRQLDETRYSGALCAEHAGHPLHALSLYLRTAESRFDPRSAVAEQARVRFVRLLGALPQIGIARLTGAPISPIEEQRHVYNFRDDVIE